MKIVSVRNKNKMTIKYTGVALAFFSLSLLSYSISQANSNNISTEKLIQLTNQQREQDNLNIVVESPKLDAAAELKLEDMVSKDYFAHTSPQGVTPWYFLRKVGYEYQSAGENLALNFSDTDKLQTAWMASTEHKENILNPKFTEIGIADKEVVFDGKESNVVVEYFADPATN